MPLNSAAGGRLMCIQHLAESVADGEVGMGDDAGDRRRTWMPSCEFRSLGGDELGLADRLHVAWARRGDSSLGTR